MQEQNQVLGRQGKKKIRKEEARFEFGAGGQGGARSIVAIVDDGLVPLTSRDLH